ncbi:MAG: DNA primase [Prevotellaceae bacterium]|jgi:DNA primase|nr:DNA primase [Prevotellaceae bacterium]
MIDSQTVAKIQDAARIEEVVGDFVTLRRRGAYLVGLCPFHNEKTGSFTVSPAKGIFHCFGCNEGGNSVHFIMKHENLSFPDALKFLAKRYNIEIHERELSNEEKILQNNRENFLLINDFATKYFAENIDDNQQGTSIGKAYFYERGFSDATIKKFELGYSFDQFDAFVKEARKKNFKDDYLVQVGLASRRDDGLLYDKFRGRVMFPIHSISGKIVGFGGRILVKKDNTGKYINSPESEIYHKSNELYGIFFAKNEIVKQDRCFLVEGYTDVISMSQAGIKNVVSSSGTALTQGQIKLIHRFTPNITVIYDGDAAGIKASIRGIDLLLEEGMNIKTVLLPQGEDPDSFARKNNASDYIEYINNNQIDFIKFKIRILLDDAKNDPVKKAALINDVIRSISIIPDLIIRSEYVKECSSLLDVAENLIYNEINKISREKRRENQNNLERLQRTESEAVEQNIEPHHDLLPSERKDRIFIHESELASYFVVKDGVKPLVGEENEKGYLTVGEYILGSLKLSGLEFRTLLFRKIGKEFWEQSENKNFNPEEYFMYHTDVEISSFATKILVLTNKYTVSAIFDEKDNIIIPELSETNSDDEKITLLKHNFERLSQIQEIEKTEKLKRTVDKLLKEYVFEIILNERKKADIQLKDAYKNNADDSLIWERIQELDKKKKEIGKILDNRVVNN